MLKHQSSLRGILEKLDSFSDIEEIPSPSEDVVGLTRLLTFLLLERRVSPKLSPMCDGGISVTWGSNLNRYRVALYNDGDLVLTTISGKDREYTEGTSLDLINDWSKL